MSSEIINRENYEAFLLDKAEGTLNEENQRHLDEFLSQNPDLIPSEDDYDATIGLSDFPKDAFPNKNRLLFGAKRRKVIVKYVSVAAVGLLLIGISLFINVNRSEKETIHDLAASNRYSSYKQTAEEKTNIRLPIDHTAKTSVKKLIDRGEVNVDDGNTLDEKIVFDTLRLVRIDDETDADDKIFIAENEREIIVFGGDNPFENENIVKTNKILTYETNR